MTLDEIVTLVERTNERYGGGLRERRARGDVIACAAGLVPVRHRATHPLVPMIYALAIVCFAALELAQFVLG